ncbi:Wzz/FepE/Etk N-terminal domain-containing protein [Pedobacter sp. AW31-3R]|uniref:Wzz/FepE/Etk N-terminal domain-containing protein n=1 Tax=Pedobacter sp. AW31-3R TaxID=3445781 RepID=UPI003FA19430
MEDKSTVSSDKEITFKELILNLRELYIYLGARWMMILAFVIIGAGIGFTYAWFKKPSYVAATTFVTEEGDKGGALGQYAGLASMIGLDIDGGGGGVFQGDNILELYKSRMMIKKTLLSNSLIDGKQELLINRYIFFNRLKEEEWKDNEQLQQIVFPHGKYEGFTRIQDSLLSAFSDEISKNDLMVNKPDKKLNIIEVKVSSADEQFAKEFNNALVKNVNNFYLETKTKKSAGNLAVLQHQTDSVRRMLNNALTGVAVNAVNPNVNPALRNTLGVPSQKKQVDVQANTAILTELVKNLELSKVTLRKETPLIQIIDEPVYPLPFKGKGKAFATVLGAFLGGLVIVIVLSIRRSVDAILA